MAYQQNVGSSQIGAISRADAPPQPMTRLEHIAARIEELTTFVWLQTGRLQGLADRTIGPTPQEVSGAKEQSKPNSAVSKIDDNLLFLDTALNNLGKQIERLESL